MHKTIQDEISKNLMDEHVWLSEIVAIQRDVALTHNDLQRAMDMIAERTRALTGAESSVIEMLEGDEMVYRAASGSVASYLGLRLKAASSLSGMSVQHSKVLKCDDATTDPRVDKAACEKIGVVSMLVVPLISGKQPVGVLKVLSSQRNAFSEKHIAALELMAGVLSAALSDALVNDHLRQSEELFRAAMEYSPIGMALATPDGTWFKVNRAWCSMLGYTQEEMLSMDFRTVSHPDDISISLETMRIMEHEKRNHHYEKRFFHKNGSVVWTALNVSPVRDGDEKLKYIIAQIEDITERKHVERMKTEFISTVNHELRTPLTAIHGALGLLANGIAGKLPPKATSMVDIAYKNSDRAVRIINDMLDLQKIEAGKMSVNLAPVEALPFLESAILSNEAYGEKFNVAFVLDPTSENAILLADEDRLMQIMANLLSNAAKFSKEGQHVILRSKLMQGCALIEVEDYGAGIPETFRTEIFDKFVQADSSDARKHYGTGLGLNIVKQLVELMGGSIDFRSKPGEGTNFFFTVPLVL